MPRLNEILTGLGFKWDPDYKEPHGSAGLMPGWRISRFFIEKKPMSPQIELRVSQHPSYGTNIAFYSVPWNERYHSYTGRPIENEEQALAEIRRYLIRHSL